MKMLEKRTLAYAKKADREICFFLLMLTTV